MLRIFIAGVFPALFGFCLVCVVVFLPVPGFGRRIKVHIKTNKHIDSFGNSRKRFADKFENPGPSGTKTPTILLVNLLGFGENCFSNLMSAFFLETKNGHEMASQNPDFDEN